MHSFDEIVPVLIVGGGPVGLTLALELQRFGVSAILLERNPDTTHYPKMDVTNGRSMEIYRRLGIADDIRKQAVPEDIPMSVVWTTRPGAPPLAKFDYPSVDAARMAARKKNDGTQPLEPSMRISQAVLEPALKETLERDAADIDARFGWKLLSFEQDADGVTAFIADSLTGETRTIRSQYLAGSDGAGSRVRRGLGIDIDEMNAGDLAVAGGGLAKSAAMIGKGLLRGEKPYDGRVRIIHFKTNDPAAKAALGNAWHLQLPDGSTFISQNADDIWTLHMAMRSGDDLKRDPEAILFEVMGFEFDCEILIHSDWRPRLALAQSYGDGRVWLAGDSAHEVYPSGGYGMNTGIGDAAGLGWALAANVQGWGGASLLRAYGLERWGAGKLAVEASQAHMAQRLKIVQASSPKIYRHKEARDRYGDHIQGLGNLENEAIGVELGQPYDTSHVICHDPGAGPSLDWRNYRPSTRPGSRPPSVYLDDGTAIFDLFGKGFTLLNFSGADVSALIAVAKTANVSLKIINIQDEYARDIYERDLVLIRPDQIVCWRGDELPVDAAGLLNTVTGRT